jgi:hypothetical protein
MLRSMLDWSQVEPGAVRPISRSAFMRMAELGMFRDERVELLRGVVVKKMTIGRLHQEVVDWFAQELILALQRTLRPTQLPGVELPVAEIPR